MISTRACAASEETVNKNEEAQRRRRRGRTREIQEIVCDETFQKSDLGDAHVNESCHTYV